MTKAKMKCTKNKIFSVPYESKDGTKRTAVFHNGGFTRNKSPLYDHVDIMPEFSHLYKPRELFYRFKAGKCEYCGKKCNEITVHQVKSLIDLNGDTDWERLMKKKRRKTLMVCEECHRLIHNEM